VGDGREQLLALAQRDRGAFAFGDVADVAGENGRAVDADARDGQLDGELFAALANRSDFDALADDGVLTGGDLISLGHCAATTGCPSENNEGAGIARDTQSLVLDNNVSDRHTQTAREGISVGGSGNLPWTTCGFVPGFVFPTPAPLP